MALLQIILFIIMLQFGTAFSTSTSALRDYLHGKTYNKEERPYANSGQAVNVTVQLFIHSIGPFDETNFKFAVGFYLREWWTDPRLKLENSSQELSTTSLEHLIWTPEISVQDGDEIHYYDKATRTILGYSTGAVYRSHRLKATRQCLMDLSHYPMDVQHCYVDLETYAFKAKDIELFWHEEAFVKSKNLQLSGYDLIETWAEPCYDVFQVGGRIEVFKTLRIHFHVKRTFLYFIYRAYVPSILLLAFAFGSFWIPDKAIPARMTIIVTSFLASMFILQGVTEGIVKVSYTTPMQYFLIVNISLIVFALLEYLVVLSLRHSKSMEVNTSTKDTRRLSTIGRVFAFRYSSNEDIRDEQFHPLDKSVRVLAVLAYVIYCGAYFGYYIGMLEYVLQDKMNRPSSECQQ